MSLHFLHIKLCEHWKCINNFLCLSILVILLLCAGMYNLSFLFYSTVFAIFPVEKRYSWIHTVLKSLYKNSIRKDTIFDACSCPNYFRTKIFKKFYCVNCKSRMKIPEINKCARTLLTCMSSLCPWEVEITSSWTSLSSSELSDSYTETMYSKLRCTLPGVGRQAFVVEDGRNSWHIVRP